MKFRLRKGRGSVNRFTDAKGISHYPGDVVELPESYLGEKWLEPVVEKPKAAVPAAKVEPEQAAPAVPLDEKKTSKKHK